MRLINNPPPCLSERGTWCVFIVSLRLPVPGEVSERFVRRPLPILRRTFPDTGVTFLSSFFDVLFHLVLNRFLKPFVSQIGSQNRSKTLQKEILKQTWRKLRFPTPFWDDFSKIFHRFSRQFLKLLTIILAAFLQKGESQSDREDTMFCD